MPKIFGTDDDPERSVSLPPAPEMEPDLAIPKGHPKMYQLVAMSEESSFWWDSVDDGDEPPSFNDHNLLREQFEAGLVLEG